MATDFVAQHGLDDQSRPAVGLAPPGAPGQGTAEDDGRFSQAFGAPFADVNIDDQFVMPPDLQPSVEQPVEPPQVPDQTPVQVPDQPPAPSVPLTPEQVAYLQRERELYAPLVQFLGQNPDLLDQIDARMRGGQVTPPKPVEPPLVEPQRPTNFNMADLVNPESESAKYMAAQQTYLSEKMRRMEQSLEEQRTQAQEQAKRAESERRVQMQVQATETFLAKKFGATPDELRQFREEMSRPDSVKPDALFQYWRYTKGKAIPQARPGTPAPQSRPASPPPAGGQAIFTPAPADAQAGFTAGMKAWKNGNY
jgi:hypothetical protein